MPKVFRYFALCLDDFWFYNFHRTTYPKSTEVFLENIDIINDLRFSPWLLNSFEALKTAHFC
jgi:hypothetical protein